MNSEKVATYGWIITRDYISDPKYDKTSNVGTMGPRNLSDEIMARLKNGEGKLFKMFDDDGEHYYSGRIIMNEEVHTGFEPLDDFGTPDAGCTSIKYRNPYTRRWDRI